MFTELAEYRTQIDPMNNPSFAPVAEGDGQATFGNGVGAGFFDWQAAGIDPSSFTRADIGTGEQWQQGGVDPQALQQFLAQRGLQLMEQPTSARTKFRWLQDASGNMVGEPQRIRSDDRATLYAGLAGLALAGGAAAGAGVGSGGAGTAGAGAGGAGAGAAAGGAESGLGAAGANAMGSAEAAAAGGSAAGGAAAGGSGAAVTAPTITTTYGAGGAGTGVASGSGGLFGSLTGGSNGWVGPALQLGGAALNQYQSGKVLDAQTAANKESNALLRTMYDTQRQDYAPWREAGTSALTQIQALLKDPSSITTQPGYQFGLDQGTKAMNNSAAARGMTFSGQALKDAQRYGQDYAGTKLNESYNRLSNLAGLGQIGTTGSANAAGQFGQQMSQNALGLGNAQGGAYAATANGWNNAFGNIANQYQQNQLIELLKQQNGG